LSFTKTAGLFIAADEISPVADFLQAAVLSSYEQPDDMPAILELMDVSPNLCLPSGGVFRRHSTTGTSRVDVQLGEG
jgi:hypothetical protein